MEIAFIHPSQPGEEGTGATHSATQIVRGLAARDHEVTVICPKPISKTSPTSDLNLCHLPVEGALYQYQGNLRLNSSLKRWTSKFDKFDIVHSYLTVTIPSLEAIGRETTAATVVTLNAYGGICAKNDLLYKDNTQCEKASLKKCFYCVSRTSFNHPEKGPAHITASRLANLKLVFEGKQSLEYIDAFRAPSRHVRSNYSQFGFPSNRIHVIPHPLNHQFLIDHQSDFEEPYRLLYVGFLKGKKGVNKLIPIVARLQELTDKEFTLSIVGEGPYEAQMRKKAKTLDVDDIVDFCGFVPNEELPDVYANHDLFVYPSLWEEPLGRVYLESLATGTPIVSSEYGSIREIIGDAGKTVDGNEDVYAQEIHELFSKEKLSQMSQAAKHEVNQFHRDRVISDIENMYEEIAR